MNIGIADFRNNMADPINRAIYAGERVVITRDGKPAVALVSIEDLRVLEDLENRADLKAALKARKQKGGIPLEEIEARQRVTLQRQGGGDQSGACGRFATSAKKGSRRPSENLTVPPEPEAQ